MIRTIKGGVTAAKGFCAASTAAGIKYQNRQDMAMIYSEVPCAVAGTFTTNLVKAAPVKWDQKIVYETKKAQAVVINAGIANACTGEEGMRYCRQTAEKVGELLPGSQGTGARGIDRSDRHAASDGAHLCRN